MAGLVPAIHDLSSGTKNVDARDKPGHDEVVVSAAMKTICTWKQRQLLPVFDRSRRRRRFQGV
jgi:hypothetical protein